MTQDQQDRFLHYLRQGWGPHAACLEVATAYSTYKRKYQEDSDFRVAVKQAGKVAVERIEAQLYEMASDGNLAAIKFYLTNRRPNRWREKAPDALPNGGIVVNIANVARQIAETPDAATLALEAVNRINAPKMLTVEARPA